jgi:O-antigen ligase
MQGIFSGPFHAATACLLLIVWGIARFGTFRRLAPLMVALGFLGMYLTLVRTAYVALGLAVLALILCAPTAGKVLQRVAGATFVVFISVALIGAWNPDAFGVVDSITGFSTDNRFLGRFPGYAEGINLVLTSPIVGWGSGSAGDTLEKFFVTGEHVTSHNILLKVLIEGGLVGAVLWIGLVYAIFRLLGMGLTGSSLETLPLTWFIFLFVGMAITTTGRAQSPEAGLEAGRVPRVGIYQR